MEPDSEPKLFSWQGSGSVLIADDEPTVRTVTVRALQRLGFSVTPVENGQEAVARFAADPAQWRLVILDLSMPLLGGDAALEQIRAIRGDVPALIYSGYSESDLTARISSGGSLAFLQKPFTVRELSDAIRKLLGDPA